MNKSYVTIVVLLIIVIGVAGLYSIGKLPGMSKPDEMATTTSNQTGTSTKPIATDHLRVNGITENAVIKSPLTITGEAKGWYFEASFPVKVLDANGKVIAQGPAQAQSDWMTADFVPFKITLTFSAPTTPTGTLVFEKDNPSGLPENSESVKVPVRFDQTAKAAIPVKVYFANPKPGEDVCSTDTVRSVDRQIPYTVTTLKDTINLLLQGPTAEEKAKGFKSEYPNKDFKLVKASILNSTATLEFTTVPGFTTGGSCRTTILASQIIKTAKQFPNVKTVILQPEDGLFQP
jgi:hypothetical protein